MYYSASGAGRSAHACTTVTVYADALRRKSSRRVRSRCSSTLLSVLLWPADAACALASCRPYKQQRSRTVIDSHTQLHKYRGVWNVDRTTLPRSVTDIRIVRTHEPCAILRRSDTIKKCRTISHSSFKLTAELSNSTADDCSHDRVNPRVLPFLTVLLPFFNRTYVIYMYVSMYVHVNMETHRVPGTALYIANRE